MATLRFYLIVSLLFCGFSLIVLLVSGCVDESTAHPSPEPIIRPPIESESERLAKIDERKARLESYGICEICTIQNTNLTNCFTMSALTEDKRKVYLNVYFGLGGRTWLLPSQGDKICFSVDAAEGVPIILSSEEVIFEPSDPIR